MKKSEIILKHPKIGGLDMFLNNNRANLSDFMLMNYFKGILFQCKYYNRDIDTLLKYVNELEYRGISYRVDMR